MGSIRFLRSALCESNGAGHAPVPPVADFSRNGVRFFAERRSETAGRGRPRRYRRAASAKARQGASSQKPRAAPEVEGSTKSRVLPIVAACQP